MRCWGNGNYLIHVTNLVSSKTCCYTNLPQKWKNKLYIIWQSDPKWNFLILYTFWSIFCFLPMIFLFPISNFALFVSLQFLFPIPQNVTYLLECMSNNTGFCILAMIPWTECCGAFANSCSALCNPTDCNQSGFPVFHYLLEFAQIHVHWVSKAI